jgi:hypothetical protein
LNLSLGNPTYDSKSSRSSNELLAVCVVLRVAYDVTCFAKGKSVGTILVVEADERRVDGWTTRFFLSFIRIIIDWPSLLLL